MALSILRDGGSRKVILFYGVRNEREHAFHDTLQELAGNDPRLLYIPCRSRPLGTNSKIAHRRVDADLLRQLLPDANFPVYICGPSAFMESMVTGLREWGMEESDIHFEAFGPSSVKRASVPKDFDTGRATTASIVFEQSEQTATWDGSGASLLELGESRGVPLPSGCRTGNCGMCAVRLVAGRVRYSTTPSAPIDPGFCLTCVTQPDTEQLILDA
jgi:hypothetical protein